MREIVRVAGDDNRPPRDSPAAHVASNIPGDPSVLSSLAGVNREALEPFQLFNGRTMDELLRWRMFGHFAASLIAAPPASNLTLSPANVKGPDGALAFLPAMDEEMRQRVINRDLTVGRTFGI